MSKHIFPSKADSIKLEKNDVNFSHNMNLDLGVKIKLYILSLVKSSSFGWHLFMTRINYFLYPTVFSVKTFHTQKQILNESVCIDFPLVQFFQSETQCCEEVIFGQMIFTLSL